VEVYWPEDKTWYAGKVKSYRSSSANTSAIPKHIIEYSNGQSSHESFMSDFSEELGDNWAHVLRLPQVMDHGEGGEFSYPDTIEEAQWMQQCRWKQRGGQQQVSSGESGKGTGKRAPKKGLAKNAKKQKRNKLTNTK
jgi:hypothetical protein